jgi:hypothetical protein
MRNSLPWPGVPVAAAVRLALLLLVAGALGVALALAPALSEADLLLLPCC